MNNALKIKKAKSVFEGQPSHGWVWVNATSEEEANDIIRDALNAHPDIKCDWVEVAFSDNQ